ncbi:MAG: carbohydrate binding domain-containing protein [Prevotella sp.]|nr:carbohydrate binding domain-containing protein [Prevotella sp.]
MKLKLLTLGLMAGAAMTVSAQHVMNVDTKAMGAAVQPTMYGLFFEDINFAADGGLYGELVKNRSFEFPQSYMGWRVFGNVELEDDGPFERCPHYVVLSDPGHKERRTGLQNEGYFGIGVEKDKEYRFTVWAKAPEGKSQIRVQLIKENTMEERQEFVEKKLDVTSSDWQKYTVTLRSPRTEQKAQLRIFLSSSKPVCLEHISLFPLDTYKGRENGLRRDLAQALEDIHPGVFRFPGGCIVEGTDLETRYQWKNSIGPVENRPLNRNRWEDTFDYRYFSDYYQSYGLGFYEFFLLSEDIGAEPLPVLSVGLSCQFQNKTEEAHVPMDKLDPYIQDCLDLIEFANGDVNSEWGKKRAEMGHPAPFNLKYIGVGNEQWDDLYYDRLEVFMKAIRAKYPDIKIVGTSGPDSEGKMFDKGWAAMKRLKADLVDEHFYRNEDWFLGTAEAHAKYGNCGATRYESYDRKGPKVFAGEYACHGKNKHKWNHYEASLYEAAFMTDMERNADVVYMTAYAPLLAHVDGWQWRPDLIWFDNTRMFRSVSYYVQQMYATNKGTNVLQLTTIDPLDAKGKKTIPVAGQRGMDGLFASSVYEASTGEVIIKVINTSGQSQNITINLLGMKGKKTAQTLTLQHKGSMDDENTLDEPNKIVPKEGSVKCTTDEKTDETVLKDLMPAMSFRIYKVK